MERLKRNKKQVKYFDGDEDEEEEEGLQFSGMESDNGSDWNKDQDDSD